MAFRPRHGRQTHCTRRCVVLKYRSRGRRVDPVIARCDKCAVEFLRTNPTRRFCSRRCQSSSTSRSYRQRVPIDLVTNRDRARHWYWANQERARSRASTWAREHRDHKRAQNSRRRARERGDGERWSHDDWLRLVEAFDHRCAYCGASARLTVDHRVPLMRGGPNTIANILPACKSCNSRKGRRTEAEYLAYLDQIPTRDGSDATMTARGAAQLPNGG